MSLQKVSEQCSIETHQLSTFGIVKYWKSQNNLRPLARGINIEFSIEQCSICKCMTSCVMHLREGFYVCSHCVQDMFETTTFSPAEMKYTYEELLKNKSISNEMKIQCQRALKQMDLESAGPSESFFV